MPCLLGNVVPWLLREAEEGEGPGEASGRRSLVRAGCQGPGERCGREEVQHSEPAVFHVGGRPLTRSRCRKGVKRAFVKTLPGEQWARPRAGSVGQRQGTLTRSTGAMLWQMALERNPSPCEANCGHLHLLDDLRVTVLRQRGQCRPLGQTLA